MYWRQGGASSLLVYKPIPCGRCMDHSWTCIRLTYPHTHTWTRIILTYTSHLHLDSYQTYLHLTLTPAPVSHLLTPHTYTWTRIRLTYTSHLHLHLYQTYLHLTLTPGPGWTCIRLTPGSVLHLLTPQTYTWIISHYAWIKLSCLEVLLKIPTMDNNAKWRHR